MLTSGNQMVHPQMPFPPRKKVLDIPPELIDQGHLLGCQIMAVGGHPIGVPVGAIPDQPHGLFRLAHPRRPQQDDGIVQYHRVRGDRVARDLDRRGVALDAADEVFCFALQPVKRLMALIPPIHDAGLTRFKYLADKRPFRPMAIGEKDLVRDRAIDIEPHMGFGLLGAFPVIGPMHGEHGVNQ